MLMSHVFTIVYLLTYLVHFQYTYLIASPQSPLIHTCLSFNNNSSNFYLVLSKLHDCSLLVFPIQRNPGRFPGWWQWIRTCPMGRTCGLTCLHRACIKSGKRMYFGEERKNIQLETSFKVLLIPEVLQGVKTMHQMHSSSANSPCSGVSHDNA